MRRGILLLLVLLLLPLSGCFDAMDLGDQIFAVNLALDTGETHALRLTMQFPQITPVGKEASSAAGQDSELSRDGYTIEQVEGDSLSECLTLIGLVTPRHVDLMHLRGVFLSESLTHERSLLWSCLEELLGTHEARPSAYVFVTRGRAEDVLMNQVPLFGARLSKSQSAQGRELIARGVVPSVSLSAFRYDLSDSDRNAVAMLCAVNGMQYLSTPSPRGEQATSYLAGDLPRNTIGAIDYCGSAVFGKEELLLLDGYETQLYNLLIGGLESLTLEVDGVPVELTFPGPARIRVDLAGETPWIRIRVPVRADTADAAPYYERLKQDIAGLLLKLQQQGLDPVYFSKYARAQTRTFAEWKSLDWRALYHRANFDIDVV